MAVCLPDVDLRLNICRPKSVRRHSANRPVAETGRPAGVWGNCRWHGIKFLVLVGLLLWTATPATAQPPYGYAIYYEGVNNAAGCTGGAYGPMVCLSPPASTNFSSPNGLALDLAGNLYIADTGNNRILKVSSGATTAAVFTISGLTNPSTLSSPNQLAVDSDGNLYIADTGNNRIVEVSPSGSASVLSTGSYTLSGPQGVAIDASGDVFVSDTGHHRIVELPSGGSAAPLSVGVTTPTALAVDTYGSLYIIDVANNQVITVNTSLQSSTLSFSSGTNGTPSSSLVSPASVTVANNGVIYITDPGAYRIAVIDPQGDNYDFTDDIIYICGNSCLTGIGAIATDSKGTVYVTNNAFSPNQVWALQQGSANFGHATLGASGTTLTLNFNLSPGFIALSPANTTVKGVSISTAGALTSDFTITGDGCTGAIGYYVGACQVNVQFTPTAAGLRRGALVLSFTSTSAYTYLDSGNFTVPLFGIGDAPVAALSPGAASHLSTGTLTFPQAFAPYQTAYDGAGNIYVTDGPNNRVLMVPKGGGNASVVNITGLSLSNPTGLAIDGSGNLFIADSGNNRIVEVTASGVSLVVDACSKAPIFYNLTSDEQNVGFLTSPPQCASTELREDGASPYSFNNPQSLFIDGSGNLTVDDAGNQALVQLAPNYYWTNDNTLAFSNVFVMATGSVSLGTNSSFAVDTNEGLYISDETNNRIIHVDRFGKTSIVDFSSLSTALTSPHSLALDPMGNLYVMDAGGTSGAQRIVQEIITGSFSAVTTSPYVGTVSLGGSLNGLAVDNFGNLLVSDFGGSPGTGHLTQINVGESSLSFPNTPQNSSSSAMTATVTNLGDQALALSADPGYTANFSQNTSDFNPCTSTTSLMAAELCDVSIKFTPQSEGSLNTTINITDNTQNATGSTQQISVIGTGTAPLDLTTTTTVTPSPASAVYGQSVTFTATISGTSTPTGIVTFTDQTTMATLASAVPLSSGVANTSTSALAVGSHSIQATYIPAGNFLSSDGSNTVTIAKASTNTGISLSNSTLTATVIALAPGAGTPTGTVQFLNGSTVIGSGTLSGGTATLAVSLTPPYSLTAAYSGDANFSGSTSGALIPTTTTVILSSTSAIYGQPLTLQRHGFGCRRHAYRLGSLYGPDYFDDVGCEPEFFGGRNAHDERARSGKPHDPGRLLPRQFSNE